VNSVKLATILRRFPKPVFEFARVFNQHNAQLYVVGGAVRNALLGQKPSDFDFTTDATPDQVISFFRRVIPTGVDHGTVTVLFAGQSFEVTTYRSEDAYTDHRRPDRVVFGKDVLLDLQRRDFTINAMAIDPLGRQFLDQHNGEEDLHLGIVRAIGDPITRFTEDALRMMRAVRFSSQLQFSIEQETAKAMSELSDTLSHVSAERVRDEFSKILLSPKPSSGILQLEKTGLLSVFFAELAQARGVAQRGRHRFDVFDHSVRACDLAPPELELRLAALLHDIGKPDTASVTADGDRTFYGHDKRGAEITEEVLRRLRYPNSVIKRVVHLVNHHMFSYSSEWSDAAVRRFISRVGYSYINDLIALRQADSSAVRDEKPAIAPLIELKERVDREVAAQRAFTVRDLSINGNDLLEAGIPRGPLLGVILNELLETVMDDPSQNNRTQLIAIAKRLFENRLHEGPGDS
jgi:poly(A) polymerase/tRNA nucleotidyltransferase (CCA-adding enzyme)